LSNHKIRNANSKEIAFMVQDAKGKRGELFKGKTTG
jgi:hypothetical protein